MIKKIAGLLSVVALALLVVSCQFSENISINEDGSGTMEFMLDGSQLMGMMGNEMAEGEEKMDTVFYFKDLIEMHKDSIAGLTDVEKAKLYAMKDFGVRIKMDSEKQEMIFNMFTDFKNVNELQDMFAAMNKLKSLGGEGDPAEDLGAMGATDLKYTFDGKKFSRKVAIKDQELFQKQIDSLGESAAMFGSSSYTLNYHFPKKIKTVSNPGAVISEDGKSVTIEYSFLDFLKEPESMNIEVEFVK